MNMFCLRVLNKGNCHAHSSPKAKAQEAKARNTTMATLFERNVFINLTFQLQVSSTDVK